MNVLGYGAAGLGFLLAGLAYKLLRQAQLSKDARPEILRSIYIFEAFCLGLVIIGAMLQYSSDRSATKAAELETVTGNLSASLDDSKRATEEAQSKLGALQNDGDKMRAEIGRYKIETNQCSGGLARRDAAIEMAVAALDRAVGGLSSQMEFAKSDGCSNGVPPNRASDIEDKNMAIASEVENARGTLNAARQ